ncbi:FAD/FMN-containing dehydrogenase/Fe-S oxidoreductase [Lipingzhangella halophila]|uniref:FAD/FMN-containing dehydrogenase/Fe-S oxidoreductase n=1 Tax=Lipingzhangella halophila TaxID=1783352 RepID=A0A7W7RE76_9ACTN|nr:FAD-binding and (Fe-S)-binding domain-containing protein [Lipingzhangella halophila]MBB4930367.1 FAD/FMN-containing dehydrogenase/Fe-S oxidoreductase [Lipingzhangella halophila]
MADLHNPEAADDVDIEGFQRDLRAGISGSVSFDSGTRALYTADASNYRHVPLGVVVPRTIDDIIAAVAACNTHGVPLTPRGGGTSIAGNSIGSGLVIDTSRHLTAIEEIDPAARVARVQPGVILDDLRRAAQPHGLTFGPDPSTHSRCTLGGMIGNNACGSHSVAWGTTADNVESLDILTHDGTRMTVGATSREERERLAAQPTIEGRVHAALRDLTEAYMGELRTGMPQFSRRVSGYALDHLLPENGGNVARALTGTEGTCVTILGATVRLVESPPARALVVLGYPDPPAAADAVPEMLGHSPLTVEGLHERLLGSLDRPGQRSGVRLPEGRAWLLVEIGGEDMAAAAEAGRAMVRDLTGAARPLESVVVTDPAHKQALWRVREEGAGLATRAPDGTEAWPGWEDAAVPPEKLGSYLRGFDRLMERHGRDGVAYGHFGEGCIHIRIDFDLASRAGRGDFRAFMEEASDLVAEHGGSLSGEHGDGQARSEMLPRMYSEGVLKAFSTFKSIWDPRNMMNPGVIVDPAPIDADLRVATVTSAPPTLLSYPEDQGDFARAMRRCMGVGKCRRHEGPGVMCPSYMVTEDEKHSTRGRARMLFEMINGEVITDGWRSEEVRDSLDLCLSCKGCRSDCPVNVDMAAYKAEFLHHHYEGRVRPAAHYSMGWLPVWARLATLAPAEVNRVSGARGLASLLKRAGGIAQERTIPEFARTTFTRWFRRRGPSAGERGTVLLWPDTFDNYLTPRVPVAAVRVLEDAGFRVVVPKGQVCCGLTWMSTGQLGVARRVMRRTLRALAPYVAEGIPIVGLEPSCTAALRTDLVELLPGEPSERVAESVYTLAGFLAAHAPDWSPPRVDARALSQVHCHQHAVIGFDADRALMERAGIDGEVLESGCCGLAGNFGFEDGHYDISKAVGERVLLPAVREADPDTLVLADGFSCRTQITQEAGRPAQHIAEVLASALDQRNGR